MRVIVIGGGAAGMLAAISAAENGAEVILLEKNEKLGKKIYITGKGRCNITNDCDAENFFANVVCNSKFLYSAYYSFDNNMIIDLLSRAGLEMKTERGNRVFPVSDHSSDVIRTLSRILKENKVDIRLNTSVKDIIVENGVATGVILDDGKKIASDSVILATGGLSYSSTGSTGDGHKLVKKYGHTVMECKPALVPFETEDKWCYELQGLALKNVSVALYSYEENSNDGKNKKQKAIYEGFGEMLFTHFGVSGPLIISASSYYSKKIYGKRAKLIIDLKPALSDEQLDKRLLKDFEENNNKAFKNSLNGLLPSRLIGVIISKSGIDPEKPVHSISREERQRLLDSLKRLEITIKGTREFNEAIITQGGINVKEVNPSTMESKIVKNLYFAGELLDLDALTGGYNLQIAWSTGHLAGQCASVTDVI